MIKGKIIKQDLLKADELLSILIKIGYPNLSILQGLLSYNKSRFKEAIRYFEEGSKSGDLECMCNYAKMLF